MAVKLEYNPSTGKLSWNTVTGKLSVVDDEVAPGEGCSCWYEGGPYGPLPTPSELTVTIEGVTKGDLWAPSDGEAYHGTFTITQSDPIFNTPCFFSSTGPPRLSIPLAVSGLISAKTGPDPSDTTYFVQTLTNVGSCWTVISNAFTDPATTRFYGGTMTLGGY